MGVWVADRLGIDPARLVLFTSKIKGGSWNTQLGQRLLGWQLRLLDQPDDLQLLRRRVPHRSSPPSTSMLFLIKFSSRACSATTSLRSRASLPRPLTFSELASRIVSPARRFLPASRNSLDQAEYWLWAMPSWRHRSAMLDSPRRPARTIRIFSSADYRRRVWRLMSLTTRSASSVKPESLP